MSGSYPSIAPPVTGQTAPDGSDADSKCPQRAASYSGARIADASKHLHLTRRARGGSSKSTGIVSSSSSSAPVQQTAALSAVSKPENGASPGRVAGMNKDGNLRNSMHPKLRQNIRLFLAAHNSQNTVSSGDNRTPSQLEAAVADSSVPSTSTDAPSVKAAACRAEPTAPVSPSDAPSGANDRVELDSVKHDSTEKDQESSVASRPAGSRWGKLRTTVKMAGAVSSHAQSKRKRKQSTLDRQDSFLKRFSTRHGGSANVLEEESDDDYEPKVEYFDEDQQRDRLVTHMVINPDENFMFYWLGVLTLAVLYNLWTCIAREAFPEIYEGWETVWIITDAVCDFIYLMDIGIQLRTGYLEKGLIVFSSRKLARKYIYSRKFIVDLLSLLPLDLLQLYIGIHPLIRFPRFIKAFRAYRFAFMVETRTIYPNMWRVANLSHVLFLGSHWFAAFYFMISKAENYVGTWSYPVPEGEFASVTRKYLKSLYWSTLTLTTIGDLPPPESNWEYVFTIVSYLIGVFVFATIVGQVGNVITNKNASRQEFERLLDGAKAYMRNHNVPQKMQRRVQRWYDYAWSRGRMNGGGDINSLVLLPDKLKTELALHVNLGTLKRVTIFQECEPEFLHDLVLKMRAFIFTPGDLICRKGEVAREMFIIADGLLEVISDSGEVLTQMSAGDFFGEIGILNLDGGVNRRTADVRSVGYSELFVLSRDDVLSALKDHPEAEALIMEFGRKRLQELGDHKRKKLQEKLARKMANSEDTSPVHQILNSSADILQTVIAVGRRHTQTYELSEEKECSKLNREGGITLLGNISPTLGVKPRSPVPGLTSQRRGASPRSRCIANGLKHRVAIGNENRGNKADVKDPMELVPLCSAPHHNDRLNEGDEGYSNKLFQRRESGGTLETPLSEPDEVLIVSSDTRTDPSSCSIKVISPDCEEVKDSKDQSMSHDETDYNRNLRQNSKGDNIVRSNSYYGDRTSRHNGGKQKDRADKWARERKGRSLEIAEAKGECTRQKMDYLAVDSDEVPNLSRSRSLPMSIDNSLGTNAFASGSWPATSTPAPMSNPVDAEDITNDLGEILIGFKGIIERKLRQCGVFYEARIAELEAVNARREEQIQQLTQLLNNLQSSLPPQPSRLPSVQDPSQTTRL